MRSVTYKQYGAPSVLTPSASPMPDPSANDVLIRVAAAGVNPVDARIRSGEMRWLLPGGFPRIPGFDVAGRVDEAPQGAPVAAGDRVLAYLNSVYGGGYAEFAVCPSRLVSKLPPEMPIQEAAALPLAGTTALQSLRRHARMRAGDRVLILGATGGVGAFAVQIAQADGARVTGVASGRHEDFCRRLGAEDFLDYQSIDYAETGRTWDVVFDAAGKSSFSVAKRVLAQDGRYVTTEPSLRAAAGALLSWPTSRKARPMLARPCGADLDTLLEMYEDGDLTIRVHKAFPLEDAQAAHQLLERESFCGKLVLETAN